MKLAQFLVVFLILIQLNQIQSLQINNLSQYTQYLKREHTHSGKQSSPITYYAFVREWPATVCKQFSCNTQDLINYDGEDFNMHGLWPSGSADRPCYYPSNCLQIDYDESELNQSVLNWMNKYYTGLYNSAQSFRAHEFEKHGTCYEYNDSPDQQEMENTFFQKIEQLNDQYNLMKALSSRGIVPSDTQSYSVENFVNTINQAFGSNSQVSMTCLLKDGKQYISSIEIDFDTSFNLTDNPCHPTPKLCNQAVDLWFPVFQR